jgi:cytochrome c oxidase cbb3-type subunit 3
MLNSRIYLICCLVCLATGSAVSAAQLHVGEYSPEDAQKGAQLFSTHCTTCHGESGTQVPGVTLLSGHFRRASSDEDLASIIRNGIPGAGMPVGSYSAAEVTALIAYLRTAPMARADAGGVGVGAGDPGRGRSLFFGKGGCSNCHRVDGEGGFRGPNLSDVGSTRTVSSLVESLMNPSSEVIPLNQEMRAVAKSGQAIIGRRMNEDTYSIQLIDKDGKLHSLLKSDLAELTATKVSPMPSYRDRLSTEELANIVAYLRSLKPND